MKNSIYHDIITEHILERKEDYYRLAYSYVRNKDDALDIVQEAICKALDSSDSLKNPIGVRTWFYRIVVNTSIDFIRKNRKTICVEDSALELSLGEVEDYYHDIDLEKAIDALSPENKTIITLRYFENFKIEEIADILGENINTVKSRLYGVLKKLRVVLEEE